MERFVKGIWIPIEIWEAEDLSANELKLLMEIDSFSATGKPCFMSNGFIAEKFGVSQRMASRYVSNLADGGYISIVKFNGRNRYLQSNIGYKGRTKSSMQTGTKSSMQTGTKSSTYNINKNTNISSIDIEDSSKTPARFNFYKSLLAAGVTEDVARTWMDVRKRKRATNSELAFQKVLREIEKSGRSADECIRIAAENSWCGFEADWLIKNEHKAAPEKPKSRSIMENNLAVLADLSGLTQKTNVDEQ